MKLGKRGLELTGQKKDSIEVRNLGTGTLLFHHPTGPIGDEDDSSLALHSRPNSLEPHKVGLITFETIENPQRSLFVTFQLDTNDTFEEHGTIELKQIPRVTTPFQPPLEGLSCRLCECSDFTGPPTAEKCSLCGHSKFDHLPI
jgi:hypothetical protein